MDVKPNTLPVFYGQVKDVKMYWDEAKVIILPRFGDAETDCYISASLHQQPYLPSWISFSPNTRSFRFFPNNLNYLGHHKIDVVLTESTGFATNTYTFFLLVVDHIYEVEETEV